MSVCWRALMAGHALDCAGVGASKQAANQLATAGWNSFEGFMLQVRMSSVLPQDGTKKPKINHSLASHDPLWRRRSHRPAANIHNHASKGSASSASALLFSRAAKPIQTHDTSTPRRQRLPS